MKPLFMGALLFLLKSTFLAFQKNSLSILVLEDGQFFLCL
jgi:hypothetical protein